MNKEKVELLIIGSGPAGHTAAIYAARAGIKPEQTYAMALPPKVDFSSKPFKVWTDDDKLLYANAVVISTGAAAKWLGIESEQRLNGNGVSACAVCDGFFFRGKEVAIVGAGDTAAEEALYLSKLCTQVHMICQQSHAGAGKSNTQYSNSLEFRNIMHKTPVEVTDNNFNKLLAANDTVVVDFWAPWCGPVRPLVLLLTSCPSTMTAGL